MLRMDSPPRGSPSVLDPNIASPSAAAVEDILGVFTGGVGFARLSRRASAMDLVGVDDCRFFACVRCVLICLLGIRIRFAVQICISTLPQTFGEYLQPSDPSPTSLKLRPQTRSSCPCQSVCPSESCPSSEQALQPRTLREEQLPPPRGRLLPVSRPAQCIPPRPSFQ